MKNDEKDNSYGMRPHGIQMFGLRDENGSLSGLLTADEIIRAAKAEAYEEAARVNCRYCRLGLPVDLVTGSVVNDLIPLGETIYLHRKDGAYLHADMPCESRHILALKDSLVARPVSSLS